ncbi:MAG: hypothetical protein HY509_01555 [Acidobacteria bacterium]|nr:hypothetical protein [Acidobacteriota bacterium]
MREAGNDPAAGPGYRLALFGATTLIGKALRECLERGAFPVRSLRLFAGPGGEGSLTEFRDEPILVTRPDPDLAGGIDLAFLCGGPEESAPFLPWAEAKGFLAIDLSTASSRDPEVPIVHHRLNPSRLRRRPGVIGSPGPVAHALCTLLAPLRDAFGVAGAVVVAFPPAADRGEEGIEELHRQTVSLLNFQAAPRGVFPRQVAFNLVPAGAGQEAAIAAETRRVLEAEFPLEILTLQAPVFHGHSLLVRVETCSPATPAEIADRLRGEPDLRVPEAGGEGITPVEVCGREGIHVLPFPAGPAPATGRWLWLVADDLRAGAAWNAVRLAERLLGGTEA